APLPIVARGRPGRLLGISTGRRRVLRRRPRPACANPLGGCRPVRSLPAPGWALLRHPLRGAAGRAAPTAAPGAPEEDPMTLSQRIDAMLRHQLARWEEVSRRLRQRRPSIAIASLPGAGGEELGRLVAEALGLACFGREIVDQ